MSRMDYWEFDLLVSVAGPWHENGLGQIRNAGGDCPLQALSGEWLPNVAAEELGIPRRAAFRIAEAADHDSPWRPLLLQLCGLQP